MLLKKKIPKYIIDDTEISSDSDKGNSDEENSDGENPDKENYENTNMIHILKLIFEACKKYFLYFFFVYIKNG